MTAPEQAQALADRLAETTANLDAYIATAAERIAAPRIAAAEAAAAGAVLYPKPVDDLDDETVRAALDARLAALPPDSRPGLPALDRYDELLPSRAGRRP